MMLDAVEEGGMLLGVRAVKRGVRPITKGVRIHTVVHMSKSLSLNEFVQVRLG